MVEFKLTVGGFDVMVNGKLFGHLQKTLGFFTDSMDVKGFMTVPVEDFYVIAKKADEVKTHGTRIPICTFCKGTPNFPNTIYNPNEGQQLCSSPIHPASIRMLGRVQ